MVVFVSCQAKQGHELSETFVWLSTEGPNIFLLVQCCADIWLVQRDSGGSKAGLSLCQAQGFRTGSSSLIFVNMWVTGYICENEERVYKIQFLCNCCFSL